MQRILQFCPAMRRVLILILSVQFFTGNLLGVELLKLPKLVEHYRVHNRLPASNTIWEFLCMHYANAQHRNADPTHRQLPLQHFSSLGINNGLLPVPLDFRVMSDDFGYNVALPVYNRLFLPSDFRSRLLQPPRCLFGF